MRAEELVAALAQRFPEARCEVDATGMATAEAPPALWVEAATYARDELDCTYFDWLSAVDELDEGFAVVLHVWSVRDRHHLLLRTRVARTDASLPTLTGVYRGASWHERETAEMFGIAFAGHPNPVPLLLPDGFEGHPLRKEFVLASRVAKQWPGAKEPGESDHDLAVPRRRRLRPPGRPEPDEWRASAARPPNLSESQPPIAGSGSDNLSEEDGPGAAS